MEAAPTFIHLSHSEADAKLLDRIRNYFLRQLRAFGARLRDGSLVFHAQVAVINKQDNALIDLIKSRNPYIISWSNVIDYMKPTEFHAIAKQMSVTGTVHYMHSCNWTILVYGTDVYDVAETARGMFYANGYMMHKMNHSMLGFSTEPVTHYRNICGYMLGRRFVGNYMQYFFAGEKQNVRVGTFSGETPLTMANPLLRGDMTAHFMCCYDDSVEFGEMSYDYNEEY